MPHDVETFLREQVAADGEHDIKFGARYHGDRTEVFVLEDVVEERLSAQVTFLQRIASRVTVAEATLTTNGADTVRALGGTA